MKKIVSHRHFKKDLQKIELLPELVDVLYILFIDCLCLPNITIMNCKVSWQACGDCHLKFDLLMLYEIDDNQILLVGLGTHSELFG